MAARSLRGVPVVDRIQSLELRGITKKFHNVVANKDVSLRVESGEIVGLLGENGAGKTTLMNILYGLYTADEGQVRVNDHPVTIASPRDAVRLGIGMVHQHFMLVHNHSVLENVALGFDEAPFFNPIRHIIRRLESFSERYGLEIGRREKIWQLSAGQQQRVEIVKALIRGADLLILDEPTAVLTPQEAEELFAVLRRMREDGHSIILISHKLDEVLSVCDRVVVLRKGEIAGRTTTRGVTKEDLARMMVGKDILFRLSRTTLSPGEVSLDLQGVSVRGDRGERAVDGVELQVRRNEIVGIAGVSGNGQRELAEAVTGLRRVESGVIILDGVDITNRGARVISNAGLAHVPEERIRFGIVPDLFVHENSVLKQHRRARFSRVLFLNYPAIRSHARSIMDAFQVAAPSVDVPMKNLSGGNIQKLIVGRELSTQPGLMVAAHPTYGLDVGATDYIRRQLLERREAGLGVLLISEDLEEIFSLADRIAVMYRGRIMGIMDREEATTEQVGMMMMGQQAS